MKIEILYPEFCNLNGDMGNMKYLEKCIPEAEIIETSINEKPKFIDQDDISLVYMGTLSERSQEIAIQKLKPYTEKIKEKIEWPEIDILFAPHHGRDSGKVSEDVLKKLNPHIIIIGEAPSQYLNYYSGYNTITQNSAGDIVFDCSGDYVDILKSDSSYGPYLGSFKPKNA